MQKRPSPTTVPARVARTRLGSLLRAATQRKARFVITRGGEPAAVLLGIADFDDILEELDPEFQRSLKAASKEYRAGKAVTLRKYQEERATIARRAG